MASIGNECVSLFWEMLDTQGATDQQHLRGRLEELEAFVQDVAALHHPDKRISRIVPGGTVRRCLLCPAECPFDGELQHTRWCLVGQALMLVAKGGP